MSDDGPQNLIFPLIYGAMGFVGGIVGALVYNVVASLVGGFEIDLKQ